MKVFSFDIFDTLVTRAVLHPADVFRLTFRMMSDQSLLLNGDLDEETFCIERMSSEAHLLTTSDECTLDQIYEDLERKNICRAEIGRDIEIRCENTLTRPMPEGVRLLMAAKREANLICFISDTYLPKSAIISLLVKNKIEFDENLLFVSSEFGKTKRSGALFSEVQKKLKLSPGAFLHHGDNHWSDHVVPRQLGWNTVRVLPREKAKDHRPTSHYSHTLETSFVTACIKRSQAQTPNLSFVNDFLFPASAIWANWVLEKASERKVSHLCFLARDAVFPGKIAEKLSVRQDHGPEIFQLDISRKVVLPASIRALNVENLRWALRTWDVPTSKLIAKRLGVEEIEDNKSIIEWSHSVHEASGRNDNAIKELVDALRSASFEDLILSRSERNRLLLSKYIEQTLGETPELIGLVDIGWHCSIQSAFKRIFPSYRFEGFYVATKRNRDSLAEAGLVHSLYSHVDTEAFFSERATLLEHLFGLGQHGSVVGFSEDEVVVHPRYQEIPNRERLLGGEVQRAMQHLIERESEIFSYIFRDEHECRSNLMRLLTEYLRYPDPLICDYLADICVRIDHDGSTEPTSIIVKERLFEETFRKFGLRGRRQSAAIWPEAEDAVQSTAVAWEIGMWKALSRMRNFSRRRNKV